MPVERHEMKQMSVRGMGLAITTLLAKELLAHPGHGVIPAESPVHYVVEPVHSVWSVLLVVAILSGIVYYRYRTKKARSSSGN